jgi:hypothetical protein
MMLNQFKALAIAAALVATLAPASGQVAGNLPFSVAVYDGNGRIVANAIPNGRMTQIYKMDGKYCCRTSASALRIGDVVSLFEVHVGCTDRTKAELARLAPHNADRVNCEFLPPVRPYVIEEDPFPGSSKQGSGMSMLCLQVRDSACRWVYLAVQENN